MDELVPLPAAHFTHADADGNHHIAALTFRVVVTLASECFDRAVSCSGLKAQIHGGPLGFHAVAFFFEPVERDFKLATAHGIFL